MRTMIPSQRVQTIMGKNKRKGVIHFCVRLVKAFFTSMSEDLMCFGNYVFSNPVLRTIAFAAIAASLVPILLFLMFTIVNATFAFMGFLFIQLSVLAVGLSILSCIAFCTIMCLGIVGTSLFYVYSIIRRTSIYFDRCF